MALKFRRGTTAQKSGSLAVGEPYINYDLQTLQIGTDIGDVTLSTTSPTATSAMASLSASNFISTSYLEVVNDANIKGNVTIGGTIQIGDASADTLNVVASLSSSLIPQTTNIFDLGSLTKIWKDLYISTGSIKFVDPGSNTVVGTLSSNASGDFKVNGEISGSSIAGLGNASAYSASVIVSTGLAIDSRISGSTKKLAYFDNLHSLTYQPNIYFSNDMAHMGLGASAFDGTNPERLLVDSQTARIATFQTSQNSSWAEVNIINYGSGSNSSTDLVIWNDATTESSSFLDLGMNSSNYNAGAVGFANDSYLFTTANDLYIGSTTTGSHGHVHIFGGNLWDSSSISVYNDGTIGINIDKLDNNASTIPTAGYAVELSGSVRFRNNIDVVGNISSSTISGIGNVSAYSASTYLAILSASTSIALLDLTSSNNISIVSASAWGAFQSASAYSASAATALNSLSASIYLTDATQSNNITTTSASAWGAFKSASAYSASAATDLNALSASIYLTDATQSTNLTNLSSSIATRDLNQDTIINNTSTSVASRLNVIETTYATTGSNIFNGNQTVTGSVYVSGQLVVQGSSSLQNITASAVSIGTNIVVLNTATPAIRFGGLSVIDSGSTGVTGSLFWDSENNRWVYQKESGSTYSGGMLLSGPRNLGALGDEVGTLNNVITKGQGGDHITSSQITDDGTDVKIPGNLQVTGSFSASFNGGNLIDSTVANAKLVNSSVTINGTSLSLGGTLTQAQTINGAFSSSAQVDGTAIQNKSITINGTSVSLGGALTQAQTIDGAYSSSAQVNGLNILYNSMSIAGTSTALGGTISAATIGNAIGAFSSSAQITLSSTTGYSTFSASIASTDATQTSNITTTSASAWGAFQSASSYSASIMSNPISINGVNVKLGETLTQAQVLNGAISTSAQVDHNSTTNYDANKHIDHTAVSVTAGSGLSGGGTIAATRTITLDTGSAHFISGSRGSISAGSGIAITLGSIAASGITTSNIASNAAITNGQLANSSVTVTAGTGMSGGGAVSLGGSVTLTNAGVTSNVAGTGVTVSGATGAVTISIGQAVATSSDVRFNSIGVGMAASTTAGRIDAAGDVVAYSSSDRNFKENIKPIENPIDKIRKISGNTYDWKAELKDEHGYEGNDVGVIAQEIEEVLPQIVTTRDNGYKAVKYEKLVALLIEGMKEQQLQIEALRIEVEGLKKNNSL